MMSEQDIKANNDA